jgi:transcriptional regulator with XRE-family HTH domain
MEEADYEKHYGGLIAQRRKRLGFTQEELAELVSSHQTYISRIERGERFPSRPFMKSLHTVLRMTGFQRYQAEAMWEGYLESSPLTPKLIRLEAIYNEASEAYKEKIEETLERFFEEWERECQ